ncbi:glycosyltransferase family 1 protein [Whalleya microplaca]|nr:glycosyltransferase family 1 protein [Whalleya microplaca]
MSPPPQTSPPSSSRPFILIVSHTLSGHIVPMLRIASSLHSRGWHTFFLGPSAHRARIAASGATFLPLLPAADLDDRAYYAAEPEPGYAARHWGERVLVDLRLQCLEPLPAQWASFVDALETLHALDPSGSRGVVVLAEAFFHGVLPLFLGAPLPPGIPPPRASLCVSVTVPAVRSADLPPAGYPLPFDPSPAGRALNAKLWASWGRRSAGLAGLLDAQVREAGAVRGVGLPFLSGVNYLVHPVILQLGVPGLEYPRSDWPPGFRFAGLVQGVGMVKEPAFAWWSELVANSALAREDPRRKGVVVVAQGTVETNPRDLIIPTIQAFADREDVLVVGILGWKDARLSDFIAIPGNARVADYLSYDAVLEHADVWVHNAGFGAVNHGIANGVPMVVAGEGMDKTENSRRVAWSGIGVDLGCATPSPEQVREGVERVLQDPSFTKRVKELKAESEAIDCFGMVHEELLRLLDTTSTLEQHQAE